MTTVTDLKIVNLNLRPSNKKDKKDIKEDAKPSEKTPKKRVVTETAKWSFKVCELNVEYEKQLIDEIYKNEIIHKDHCSFIIQQIHQKIYGYKSQDIHKNKLEPEKLVCLDNVIHLMIEKSNMCHYCKEPVRLLYENVREPKQWTLDRINNDFGHNNDNIFLACLSCNLRRRTMYHERYVFTKQLTITKV